MMNRRKFLTASLAATAGGILVAADALSTKTFFLSPASGWPCDGPVYPQGIPLVYGRLNGYATGGSLDHHEQVQAYVRHEYLMFGDDVYVNKGVYRVTNIEKAPGRIGVDVTLVRV